MLLEAPNPKDPQDAEVAKMMMDDHEYFESVAHDWAVRYAGAPRTQPPPDQIQRKAVQKKDDDIHRYGVLGPLALTVPGGPFGLRREWHADLCGHPDIKAGTRTSLTALSTWALISTPS